MQNIQKCDSQSIIYLQLFFGEKHAFILFAYYETKMWKLRMCSIASDIKYFI